LKEETTVQLPQLKRIRWAVRAALILGVAASVAANILHALPNPISQAISAWPPLALLLTVELTSRIPMHRRGLAAIRVLATMVIACIAAWVSYWHMQDVAVRFGETEISAYLLPISVDGLIIVASVSLVELAGRIRMLEEQKAKAAQTEGIPARFPVAEPEAAPAVAPVQFVQPAPTFAAPATAFQPLPTREPFAPAAVAGPSAQAQHATDAPGSTTPVEVETDERATPEPVSAIPVSPAVAPLRSAEQSPAPRVATSPLSGRPLTQSAPVSPAVAATTRPAPAYVNGSTPPARPTVARAAVSTPARTMVTAPTQAAESTAPRQRRPVQETAELADEIEAMHPDISQTELAKRLGISPTRLRAVRREAREFRRSTGALRR
jgi:hypothetical protein